MTSFDDLVAPLLEAPPRPAPSIGALRDRVALRRRRRTWIIATFSVVVLVVVGTAVALPRDRDTDVLTGPPGTTVGSTAPAKSVIPTPIDDIPEIKPAVVNLTFDPERAPDAQTRTLTIHNGDTEPYATCYQYELQRWDGTRWQPTGSLWIDPLDGSITLGPRGAEDIMDCTPQTTMVGATSSVPFRTTGAQQFGLDRTSPYHAPATIEPGWYELADSKARGRFEVLSSVPTDLPTTLPTSGGAPTTTTHEPAAELVTGIQTVDLHPAPIAAAAGATAPIVQPRLPDHAIVVDDDTISLSWLDACLDPAHHADVTGTPDTVNIDLSVVRFELGACEPDTARYVVTFDLPFAVGGRRLIVRSADTADQLELTPKPAGSHAASTSGTTTYTDSEDELQGALVTTFRQDVDPNSPSLGGVVLRSLSCSTAFSWDHFEADGFTVSLLRQPVPSVNEPGCAGSTIAIDPDHSKAFPGVIPPAPR